MSVVCVLAAIAAALSLGVNASRPPLPPSPSCEVPLTMSFVAALNKMIREPPFIVRKFDGRSNVAQV